MWNGYLEDMTGRMGDYQEAHHRRSSARASAIGFSFISGIQTPSKSFPPDDKVEYCKARSSTSVPQSTSTLGLELSPTLGLSLPEWQR